MDTVRIEIDLPTVILNRYGHPELDNHKSVEDLIAQYYSKGDVITLHIVAESTGTTRQFCTFIDPTSAYKSECGQILDSNGMCWMESEHGKRRVKQLELEESE